jgi:hypothetical protein
MSAATRLAALPDSAVARLAVRLAGSVNLRRDLYRFVDFVRVEGLKRAHRDNSIPKGVATKLAKLLSYAPEVEAVQSTGVGQWSDVVSRIARQLGLVSFNVKGVYAGYSSTEPSFPDNHVKVDAKHFEQWLAKTPIAKERAILDALIEMTENEFFQRASLFEDQPRFDSFGCATGPASRMALPAIRKALLEMLADLPTNEWLPVGGLVAHLHAVAPNLIVDPALRPRPLSEWEKRPLRRGEKVVQHLDERYQNFREYPGGHRYSGKEVQLTEETPDVFFRVEGRYLQYFLQEIPFLCGFVDLALAPASEDKLSPPLESVRTVRFAPRLRQVLRSEPSLGNVSVTVLPNFDVLVEAPSWPDRELDLLAPWCVTLKEDGPTCLLRLDKKRVLASTAAKPDSPPVKSTLERIVSKPLPANVVGELDAWCGHAQKLSVFENVLLVELRGPDPSAVRRELGELVIDDRPQKFLIARDPERAIAVLEQRQRVPRVVQHATDRFVPCDGPFGAPVPRPKAAPKVPVRKRVRLVSEDLVGYRADDADFLTALHKAILAAGHTCSWLKQEGLVVISASNLPQVRAILKRLGERFEVES